MTQVIKNLQALGAPLPLSSFKPIKAVLLLSEPECMLINNFSKNLDGWDNIMLLSTSSKYDSFVCWNNRSPTEAHIYLGHWNDGVVS